MAQLTQQALDEIKDGHKKSCWIWYVFPQFRDLLPLDKISEKTKKYSIQSLLQAKAYLAHPILGKRLD